jgi:hypothetical protein
MGKLYLKLKTATLFTSLANLAAIEQNYRLLLYIILSQKIGKRYPGDTKLILKITLAIADVIF